MYEFDKIRHNNACILLQWILYDFLHFGLCNYSICNIITEDKDKSDEFDKKVIQLYDEGNSYLSISKKLSVDKETVRKIVLKNLTS